MNDDLEFVRELDEQAHQAQAGNQFIDAAEIDNDTESAYNSQDGSDMHSVFPSDLSDGNTADNGGIGEIDASEDNIEQNDGIQEQPAPPVSQEELNTLVGNVTEMGADETVLGKERLLEAFHEAEDAEAKGKSYVEGFTSAVERMLGVRLEPDPVEQEKPPAAVTAQPEENGAAERFQYHKERYEAQFETVSPWPRDTVSAYHRMAMTYNAYISGEKINGMEVSKIDVFLSGVRFYQSNIFETAIIRSLQFAGDLIKEKYSEDKVETGQEATETGQDRDSRLKDDVGGYDHGDAAAVSADEVKSIRQTIKEYGFDYGIDTTRGLDYNSTDNIRIFRPTDYVGRIDTGAGQTRAVPGVRMVEIDGNRALVTPDGKVAHENTRFQVGDGFRSEDYARIEYRCNALESRALKEEISHMAQARGVSVDTIKAEYAEKAMDAYATRVENTMLGEADRLERQTIPEAREELNSFREDMTKLDRIETSLGKEGIDVERGLSSAEVGQLKSSLQNGIDTLETRISAMENRVELLRDTHAQVDTSSVKDRFERAANTEEQAVGRGGRIEYISNDTDKRLADVIDAGTDRVMGDVERFNEIHPDMQITYDADTGELYNHFGVSDSGGFNPEYATVDSSSLPEDNPEEIRDYISEHAGDDFEEFKAFEEPQGTGDSVDQEQENGGDTIRESSAEVPADSDVQTDKEEETEAKVLAGQEDDAASEEHGDTVEMPETSAAVQDSDADEYREKVKELFSDYLNDGEDIVSLSEDVQNPLVDLTHGVGKEDFREAMDILSDMVKELGSLQPEQMERISDLVHAVADISEIPADAVDTFQDSIQETDFAEELIAEIGKPEVVASEPEIGMNVQVTIGGEELSAGENGLFEAGAGEPVGGFDSDDAAEKYLSNTEHALFDSPADVEVGQQDVELETPDNQQKLETFQDALEEIGGGVAVEEEIVSDFSGVEAGTEAAGVEAGEAAGGAAAAESAVEAGAAGAALL